MQAHDTGAALEQLAHDSACHEVIVEISPVPEEVAAQVRAVLARVLVAQALRDTAHSPIDSDARPLGTTMVGYPACHAEIGVSP